MTSSDVHVNACGCVRKVQGGVHAEIFLEWIRAVVQEQLNELDVFIPDLGNARA